MSHPIHNFVPGQIVEAKLSDAEWQQFEFVGRSGIYYKVRAFGPNAPQRVWRVASAYDIRPITSSLITPMPCTRCGGRGNVGSRHVHLGTAGTCFDCHGLGMVEGDAAAVAAREAEQAKVKADTATWVRWKNAHWYASHGEILAGVRHLEIHEPARHAKLVESVIAGRDDVDAAVIAYWQKIDKPV